MGKFALAQEDGTENDSKDRELVLGPERQESKSNFMLFLRTKETEIESTPEKN